MSTDHDNLTRVQWRSTLGPDDVHPRDYACWVLHNLDYEAQLVAINALLWLHRGADKEMQDDIQRIEQRARSSSGIRNELAVEDRAELLHASVFQDAANSMAAVGMLAPLIESMFHEAFQGIRERFFPVGVAPTRHERWDPSVKDQWDCHFVCEKGKRRKDLVKGIIQMSEALGLTSYLPIDLEPTLSALFAYRNKMFHCGFEWPVEKRYSFENCIKQARWPADWFARARSDEMPWIFYLSPIFVDHCLKTVDNVLCAIGSFVRDELSKRKQV